MSKFTVSTLQKLKDEHTKFGTITAYDAAFAKIFDECEVPALLIGDSLGMVIQGRDSTIGVSVEDIAYHTRCVSKVVHNSLVIADLPFMSYYDKQSAADTAKKIMEAGANVLKLEGGAEIAEIVKMLVQNGIPVCAHIGLTPQSVNVFGGYKIQGRSEEQAQKLIKDAVALQEAGASLIVLECIPSELAKEITEKLRIPTIGIGAGNSTDAQILVMHDAFGITPGHTPKFARNFLKETGSFSEAVKLYLSEVTSGNFPNDSQSFH